MHKSNHQRLVEQFMRGAGQSVPESPRLPDRETSLARARLELEECLEKIEALGLQLCRAGIPPFHAGPPEFREIGPPNLIAIIDASCDQNVVATGTLSTCGIPDIPFQTEVDENNLQKLNAGHLDEHGKFIKPADHQPPRIRDLLDSLFPGWDARKFWEDD